MAYNISNINPIHVYMHICHLNLDMTGIDSKIIVELADK